MSTSIPRSAQPGRELITDIAALRDDFPILQQQVHGKPLAYLDSAASSQRPQAVIDAMVVQDSQNHANVHRGVHELSERSTDAYEGAREKLRRFINADSTDEVIFTSGTTESINLVAASLGRQILSPGDEVLVTRMEHHSNIVPWQLICEATGARVIPSPITEDGELDMDGFRRCLNDRTKLVAVTHVSNALGTVNPVKELVETAHDAGALVLVDGAQAAAHLAIDVRDLDCDFYALSGHKMFGPTGTGILYGKASLLDSMPPYKSGGEMILTVSFEGTQFNTLPHKFEAGTPNITGVVGLGAAVDYLGTIDPDALAAHEHDLLHYTTSSILELTGTRIIGTANDKAGVVSFLVDPIHAHDLGTIVDREGVAIRTGHHCAMPVMEYFNIAATARASFALYNNRDDIDRLLAGIRIAQDIFK
ncbi:MAG: cysteine desulfurase [Gammaproteobacteria bacterium]